MEKIEADFDSAKKALYVKFAMSNVKYEKGDIIKDSVKIIIIDKITAYKGFHLPEPVYHGIELKKNLTPTKKGNRESIYGHHLVELVKKATE